MSDDDLGMLRQPDSILAALNCKLHALRNATDGSAVSVITVSYSLSDLPDRILPLPFVRWSILGSSTR